jgi:hypothetical protein
LYCGPCIDERAFGLTKKAIRVFLQDGINDNRALRGDNYDPHDMIERSFRGPATRSAEKPN